jgi:hypothetical protein
MIFDEILFIFRFWGDTETGNLWWRTFLGVLQNTEKSLIAGCCVTELLLAMETAKNELKTRFECESDLLNYIYANNTRPDTAWTYYSGQCICCCLRIFCRQEGSLHYFLLYWKSRMLNLAQVSWETQFKKTTWIERRPCPQTSWSFTSHSWRSKVAVCLPALVFGRKRGLPKIPVLTGNRSKL